jgi:two-component system chemotaxis sensor kinase CheA
VSDVEQERAALAKAAIAECEEALATMEARLMALEAGADLELINEIFRAAHNVKGLARMLGFRALSELAHVAEELLQRLRDERLRPSRPVVSILLSSVDGLRDLLAESCRTGTAAEAASGPSARSAGAGASAATGASSRSLRVDLQRLDRVIDLLGEIIIARARLDALLAGGGDSGQAHEAHRDADRLHAELRDQLMDLRMVPLAPTLRGYERSVRDVAASTGKTAALTVEAEGVEIDATLTDKLRDPLMHIVRNAVDHGIEPPDERRAAGKDPCGQIRLRTRRENSTIVVEISDDGRGLRRSKLLAKGRQLGLVGERDEPADAELWALIFHAGFSTAEKITDVSGRGVGMDVVRRNVESLRGEIAIQSEEGRGTTITIRIPMTLAIISGFRFAAGEEVFVVPAEQVAEVLEYAPADHQGDGACGVMNVRGQAIPCLRIRELFGLAGDDVPRPSVVLVRQQAGLVAMVVDRVLGESQTVVKPLGRLARPGGPVAGSTLLGSGRVALVLDAAGMIKAARGSSSNSLRAGL